MQWFKDTISTTTKGKGLYPITGIISKSIERWRIAEGMCFLYIQHTSASLLISESYDPTARLDLEKFMDKTVPEGQHWYKHTLEGFDDSPSHIRAMLTPSSLSIPIDNYQLALGTWQGIYLFEHRSHHQNRTILLRCLSINPSE